MTRAERLANALASVGCPDARSVANLTLEVLDQLDDDEVGERRSILKEAAGLVDGPRQAAYGDPVDCMDRWAQVLTSLYGWDVDAHRASIAMALLKLVREAYGPARDNRVDACGYLDIADRAHHSAP